MVSPSISSLFYRSYTVTYMRDTLGLGVSLGIPSVPNIGQVSKLYRRYRGSRQGTPRQDGLRSRRGAKDFPLQKNSYGKPDFPDFTERP